jgi:hypothetical protein
MKTYHKNSETWFFRDWSILHRIRHWFIWVGGWELANGKGWRFSIPTDPSGSKRIKLSPTPISLLGGRITFYSGRWVDIKTKHGWLVIQKKYCYISRDGTPSEAHVFYWGAPPGIVAEANKWHKELYP